MSAPDPNGSTKGSNESKEYAGSTQIQGHSDDDGSSEHSVKEVFNVEVFDPVLQKKMALVNSAIDEIGMTTFQWKMFFLNGFGYAVDSVRIHRGHLLP